MMGSSRPPWIAPCSRRWSSGPIRQSGLPPPSERVAGFSAAGRLGQRAARLVRVPVFAIAVAPLQLSEAEFEGAVARYLQTAAPGGSEP